MINERCFIIVNGFWRVFCGHLTLRRREFSVQLCTYGKGARSEPCDVACNLLRNVGDDHPAVAGARPVSVVAVLLCLFDHPCASGTDGV